MHMNHTLYQIEQLDVTPQTADLTEGQKKRLFLSTDFMQQRSSSEEHLHIQCL